MTSTLLLDRDLWDICVDVSGNIALATEPYSIAQDVASACRTFYGEVYYDTTKGVRYFQQVLGQPQPLEVLKEQLAAAARTVPGVVTAVVYLTELTARSVGGQVQFTLADGSEGVAAL